jgi:hypothetical protein
MPPALPKKKQELLHRHLVSDLIRRPSALWPNQAKSTTDERVQLDIGQAIDDVLLNAFSEPSLRVAPDPLGVDLEVAPSWAALQDAHDTKEVETFTAPGFLITACAKIRLQSPGWLRRTFATLLVLASLATSMTDARLAAGLVQDEARSFVSEVYARLDDLTRSIDLP